MKRLLCLLFAILIFCQGTVPAFAQSLDEQLTQLESQIKDLMKQKEQSENATKPLESELASVNKQINALVAQINSLTAQLGVKEKELVLLEKNITNRQEELELEQARFAEQVRILYIRDRAQLPMSILLTSSNAKELSHGLAIETSVTKQNLSVIEEISTKMQTLVDDKARAQKQKEELQNATGRLAQAKKTVDNRGNFLKTEIATAKQYQEALTTKISELSAKQQSILAAKNGTFITGVGEVPLADDPNASPNFNPGFSPAFAPFSFGGYTHRKGMSQYGAKGRAQSGQSAAQILQAYYGKGPTGKDTGGTIKVAGQGDVDFEGKYLLGIAEMPASFPKEALKAQAIAARSYAWRYKKDGKEICVTEACQVYSKSKSDSPPQAWRDAVNETKGQIIEDVVTYYSSTTGGYLTTMGWDTTSGNKDTWTQGAYEKIGNSPWFYKGWYTEGYSSSSNKCGRSHPWLKEEEMADILNAYLAQGKGGVQNDRITPTTTSCFGGNPYSFGEMRDLANSVGGGAVTSVSSVSVAYANSGSTATITFGTNRGNISIAGGDFKQIFNLRAPGYISIKSPLFNIEKK